jgi:hypothetical protein
MKRGCAPGMTEAVTLLGGLSLPNQHKRGSEYLLAVVGAVFAREHLHPASCRVNPIHLPIAKAEELSCSIGKLRLKTTFRTALDESATRDPLDSKTMVTNETKSL